MTTELKVPYLGTAEDDVLLSNWFVAEGESLVKGQVVAAVETLKASFDVEAVADGVLLRHVVDAGTRVSLQAVIALIGAVGEKVPAAELDRLVALARPASSGAIDPLTKSHTDEVAASAKSSPAQAVPATADASAAPAARRVARELGVDLGRVQGSGPGGLIRVEDVQAASRAAGIARDSADGRVASAFLDHIRNDRAAFGALASGFKVALYRQHGAMLGPGAVFAPGAVVIVDHLVLGSYAHFGQDTYVEARELRTGDRLHFGRGCRVRCTKIAIGDNASFADGVEIGGSGAFEPEAELVVGSHGFVGEHVCLDPSHRLEIGQEVVILRNAVVMTHFSGGSILRGYPVRCQGVKLGSYSQVGVGATVLPGVELGEGAMLLPNSSLVSSAPPGRLFGGVPAADLQAAAQAMTSAQFAAMARDLVVEFARQLRLRGGEVGLVETVDAVALSVADGGRVRRLRFGPAALADDKSVPAEDVRVAPCIADADFNTAPSDVVLIDLSAPRIRGTPGPLADAFREFLGRRGVRMGGS